MATATKQSRFAKGGEAAIDADEAARAAMGGGSFRKTHYLPKIGKGNSIVLRYLLDSPDWIFVQSHPGAVTKPKPSEWAKDKAFPETMPAVCRYDKAFKADPEQGIEAVYNDCYICDAQVVNGWGKVAKPVVRVYTLAILREEVTGTQEMADKGQIKPEQVGRAVGYRDASREVEVPKKDDKGETIKDAEGKTVMETITEPAIIVVNQAVSNYFGGLQSLHGIYSAQGESILDRDFIVKQNYEGKDVDYQHIPLNVIDSLKPGQPAWERYTKAIEDQGESVDLETLLMDRSSDEFYATFFDPTKEMPKRENKNGEAAASSSSTNAGPSTAQQNAAPTSEPASADALAAMRARVRGAGGAAAAAPAEATTAAPAAAEVPQETSQEPEATPAATGPIDFS